jgi:hypothetical protein
MHAVRIYRATLNVPWRCELIECLSNNGVLEVEYIVCVFCHTVDEPSLHESCGEMGEGGRETGLGERTEKDCGENVEYL